MRTGSSRQEGELGLGRWGRGLGSSRSFSRAQVSASEPCSCAPHQHLLQTARQACPHCWTQGRPLPHSLLRSWVPTTCPLGAPWAHVFPCTSMEHEP